MVFLEIINYIGHLFSLWGKIFAAPFQNFEMLWVIIPVYLVWIFTEIYQEKKFTTLGNAISNGTVVLWAGVDWIRHLIRLITGGQMQLSGEFFGKILFAIIVLGYGITIIITGVKVSKITHYLGRIREVSYVLIMGTPIFYGVINLSWENMLAIIIFFPLFYYVIEFIDKITPTPKTYDESKEQEEDLGEIKKGVESEDEFKEPDFENFDKEGKEQTEKEKPSGTEDIDIDEEIKKLNI